MVPIKEYMIRAHFCSHTHGISLRYMSPRTKVYTNALYDAVMQNMAKAVKASSYDTLTPPSVETNTTCWTVFVDFDLDWPLARLYLTLHLCFIKEYQ